MLLELFRKDSNLIGLNFNWLIRVFAGERVVLFLVESISSTFVLCFVRCRINKIIQNLPSKLKYLYATKLMSAASSVLKQIADTAIVVIAVLVIKIESITNLLPAVIIIIVILTKLKRTVKTITEINQVCCLKEKEKEQYYQCCSHCCYLFIAFKELIFS